MISRCRAKEEGTQMPRTAALGVQSTEERCFPAGETSGTLGM